MLCDEQLACLKQDQPFLVGEQICWQLSLLPHHPSHLEKKHEFVFKTKEPTSVPNPKLLFKYQ